MPSSSAAAIPPAHGRGISPKAPPTRFFQTRIALANPGTVGAAVVLRHQGDDGETWSEMVHVGARESQVVDVDGRRASSFSTVIESDQPLVVDRTMTWGGGYGSHAETATEAPSTTHFLAEGATHGRFALFYLLQNSQQAAAHVTITYLRPAPGPPITLPYVIPPASRLTIAVDAIPALAATDVSARIVSSVPILVERAMYMDTANPAQVFGAGHAGAAVTSAHPRWFLAEGATGVFFDLYYLIANPNPQPTRVQVSYLLPAGEPVVREYDVAAESRLTISVDGEDPRLLDTPVSAIVETLDGGTIVVERSMWWPGNGQWQEGHLSVGDGVRQPPVGAGSRVRRLRGSGRDVCPDRQPVQRRRDRDADDAAEQQLHAAGRDHSAAPGRTAG